MGETFCFECKVPRSRTVRDPSGIYQSRFVRSVPERTRAFQYRRGNEILLELEWHLPIGQLVIDFLWRNCAGNCHQILTSR